MSDRQSSRVNTSSSSISNTRWDAAHAAFAVGQVRGHPQLAFATDLHADDALVATFFYMTLLFSTYCRPTRPPILPP